MRVIIADDEPLVRERLRALLSADARVTLVGECEDGMQAIAAIQSLKPDLVLLDVQMPEATGFEVVEAVRDEWLPAIVFVTAFDEYAIRAFEVHAVDYLLKPFSASRVDAAISRALERRANRVTANVDALLASASSARPLSRFVARQGSRVYFVPVTDVEMIEGADNYVRLHVGTRTHLVRGTLRALEGRLDPAQFVRIHRSTMVRVDRIAGLEPAAPGTFAITMANGARIQSGRSYHARIRDLIEG